MMKATLLLPLFFILTSAQGTELPDNAPYDLASMEVDVDKFIEMNVSHMKAGGDFTAMEQVSGIDSGKLERGYRSAMKFCFDKYEQMTEENADALSNCFIDQTATEVGVTNQQFYAWLDELDRQDAANPDPLDAIFDEMDRVSEAIYVLQDKPERSAADEAQLEALERQLIELTEKRDRVQAQETEAVAAEMEAIFKRK
ncbi:hypothetical protein [Shewanella spartinae]|uniref:hypothetical protein n=1 Tax=Shewanella spartinae TaxID=2864205 RepID=UPI001C6619DE|nr:hypothetical protein [Shewanella spartinae]QYJ94482.1 hypothetical protein K0I31_03580 [Shewanella spartinae]